jgi:hypothetical protein
MSMVAATIIPATEKIIFAILANSYMSMVVATIIPSAEKVIFCHLVEYLDIYGFCNNNGSS